MLAILDIHLQEGHLIMRSMKGAPPSPLPRSATRYSPWGKRGTPPTWEATVASRCRWGAWAGQPASRAGWFKRCDVGGGSYS